MKQYRIIVSGVVQGVFFRYNARKQAENLGIRGFARNTGTGDVEIVAQGSDATISAFVDWCRKGPKSAIVRKIITEEQDPDADIKGFEIRY